MWISPRFPVSESPIWSVLTQAVVSLVNLGLGLAVYKFGSPREFGIFGMMQSGAFLLVGFANAGLLTQMTVFAPEKNNPRQYYAAVRIVMVQACLMVSVFAAALVVVAETFKLELTMFFGLALGAAVGQISMESTRRELLSKHQARAAFTYEVFSAVTILVTVALLQKYSRLPMLAVTACAVWAIGYSVLIGRVTIARDRATSLKTIFLESWFHGKFSIKGMLLTWVAGQGYPIMVGGTLGSLAVADLNLARMVVAPLGIMSVGLSKAYLPRMVSDKRQGVIAHKFSDFLRALALGFSVYLLFLLVSAPYLESELELIDSSLFWNLTGLWFLFFSVQGIRTQESLRLQIEKEFRAISQAVVMSTSLVFILMLTSVLFVKNLVFVLLAMIIGELVLWLRLRTRATVLTP